MTFRDGVANRRFDRLFNGSKLIHSPFLAGVGWLIAWLAGWLAWAGLLAKLAWPSWLVGAGWLGWLELLGWLGLAS